MIPEAPGEPQDTMWCAPGEQTDGETEDKYIKVTVVVCAPIHFPIYKGCVHLSGVLSNSHAPSNCRTTTAACYRRHEQEKCRTYERRVLEVEQSTITSLVMSTSGGWGPSATVVYKRLASLISAEVSQPYSITLYFIIDSTVMCLCGTRSYFHQLARN